MPFYFGNDFGGLQSAAMQGAQADASNFFNFAHLNQQQDAQDVAAQQAAQQQANINRRFNFDLLKESEELGLRKSNAERNAALAEKNYQWHLGNEGERQREFAARKATSLAEQGWFDSPAHARKLFPDLSEADANALGLQSAKARQEIDASVQPLQDAADTLNESLQLAAAGAPGDWEGTAAEAAKVTANKKLMEQLTRNAAGMWVPNVAPRPWSAGNDFLTMPVNGVNETARVRGGGLEHVTPEDMAEVERGGQVPDMPWFATGTTGQAIGRFRRMLKPPADVVGDVPGARFSFAPPPSASAGASTLPQPRSRAEFAVLPSGTQFLDPNGQVRIKP